MKREITLFLTALLCLFSTSSWAVTVAELSNNKCYTLMTKRASLVMDGNNAISSNGRTPSDVEKQFAIISYAGKRFLWSISANGFLKLNGTGATVDNAAPSILTATDVEYGGGAYVKFTLGGKTVNFGGGKQLTIDDWATTDDGNTFTIEEVGGFDPATAIGILKGLYAYHVICDKGGVSYTFGGVTTTYTNGQTFNTDDNDPNPQLYPAVVPDYASALAIKGNDIYVTYIPKAEIEGRCFIKSTTGGDQDKYITSMTNVMAVHPDARTYWSIWDVTVNEDGSVQIVNEGNRDIMTPENLHRSGKKDAGLLHWCSQRDSRYHVGNADVAGEENAQLRVLPASALLSGAGANEYLITGSADGENFLYLDFNGGGTNEAGFADKKDRIAKSGSISAKGNLCKWVFEKFTAEQEADLFHKSIVGLEGFVGGPVTLTNVSNVGDLNNIVTAAETAVSDIQAGAQNGAQKMDAILSSIDGIDPEGYYQHLIENRPFFLSNLCGYRPSIFGRLSSGQGISSSDEGWETVSASDINDTTPNGVFYAEILPEKTLEGETIYRLKNKEGFYISKTKWIVNNPGSTSYPSYGGNNFQNLQTTDPAMALCFKIDPVIPGVWQIHDVDGAMDSNGNNHCYVTITDTGRYPLMQYNFSETSTLWKFQTFTSFEYALKTDASVKDEDDNYTAYTTFGLPLDCRLPKVEGGVTPYYASNIEWHNNELRVTLQEFETHQHEGSDYYFLAGTYGYMFVQKGTLANDETAANYVVEERYPQFAGSAGDEYYVERGADAKHNFFHAAFSDINLTTANWEEYLALNYVEKGKTYAHYNGQPVKGIGMGFYRLAPGNKIAANKAYILMSELLAQDESTEGWGNDAEAQNTANVQMVFLGLDGNATDVVKISPDGTIYHEKDVYYDLSGREVVSPTKGIFIKNGVKVMLK